MVIQGVYFACYNFAWKGSIGLLYTIWISTNPTAITVDTYLTDQQGFTYRAIPWLKIVKSIVVLCVE